MTLILSALAFLAGFFLARVLRVEPSVVVLQRAEDDWTDLGGPWGLRERTAFSQRQVRSLLDRLAACESERRWLIDQLADKHLDEVSTERSLRMIRGGEKA